MFREPFDLLPSNNSSIYTAELQAILLALKHVYCSKGKSFFNTDSLSSLKAIFYLKYEHPVLVHILELYMTKDGKDIVFIWVPGHVGIRGNLAADSAAKDALVGNTLVELIPLSDLKSHANKCIVELWQSEWDELLGNKLHEIFPVLKQCVVCPQTNKRRNCDIPIAHWPFFYYSFLFIEEWGTANVYRMWWTINYWTYFTYLFTSYWNKRKL